MTRVCYVVDAPFLGGAERYVSRVALNLDRREFHPSLIVRASSGPDRGLDAWVEEVESAGVFVARAPMRLPYRLWDATAMLAAVESIGPEIVHVNMPGPYDGQTGLVAPIARMGGARAVVVTEHLPMVERLWKRALVKRLAYRYVDRVLTVCRANVPYLVERQGVPAEKIRVIPNGVRGDYGTRVGSRDGVRKSHDLPVGAVLVVFVGNLLIHKGLHRVIDALSRIGGRDWHLAVVGAGPEERPCRDRLDALGLGSRAKFLGSLSAAAVEDLLSSADVLALPSSIEGMPYVVLEAMASSVPVVASTVFGIPEMIRDGADGFLVAPEDVDALARALARLVHDGELRARMGASARERFRAEFTLERQVAAIEDVYRRLLARGREVPS